ncbi:MAG: S53 family peptidase [Candidatus Nitrosopolaris sp.]
MIPLEDSLRHRRHEARFVKLASPKETMSVTVSVRRREKGPKLPEYDHWDKAQRKILNRADFGSEYGASQDDLGNVSDYFRSSGMNILETSAAKRIVKVSGTVKQMNNAFDVKLGYYRSPRGLYRGREGKLSVPKHLASIIKGVFGTDNRRMARHRNNGPPGVSALTPLQVAKLYNFPDGSDSVTNQSIGILEFGGGFNLPDIQAFLTELNLPSGTSITAVGMDGVSNNFSSDPNTEAGGDSEEVMLDIEVAAAIAPGAKIVVYFAPFTEQGWVDAVSTAIHDTANSPSVLSISWGWPELESIHQGEANLNWSKAAMNTLSSHFQDAANLGTDAVTVLVASGDNGSADEISDGKAHVDYPASDPWVTACGGTRLSASKEDTWNDNSYDPGWATGGGISAVFPLPSWQENKGVPPSVNNGKIGRGIPDIAGNASSFSGYYLIINGAQSGPVGGTSAVAPLYAGLVALLNANLGKHVGYLNPILYKLGGTNVFKDINEGISNAVNGAPGYKSGAGWDACTGWGSVDGSNLLKNLQQSS